MSRAVFWLAALLILINSSACDSGGAENDSIRLAAGGKVVSLDPAFAADVASQRVCAAFFDTLLEYEYPSLPYRLRPGMLAGMPEISADGLEIYCVLRDDLFFVADECFGQRGMEARRVTSADVVFSFLRIADGRNHTANYSLIRGKIAGIDDFYRESSSLPDGDFSCYEKAVEGFEIINDKEFIIRLTRPDPRFLYVLAIPALGVVSRTACLYYDDVSGHPGGSGPFTMTAALVKSLAAKVWVTCSVSCYSNMPPALGRLTDRSIYPDERLIAPTYYHLRERIAEMGEERAKRDIAVESYSPSHVVVTVDRNAGEYDLAYLKGDDSLEVKSIRKFSVHKN